jgi:tRNA A-37 threonylcarbamoyl transferase component Bud32
MSHEKPEPGAVPATDSWETCEQFRRQLEHGETPDPATLAGGNRALLADLVLVRTLWAMGRDIPRESPEEETPIPSSLNGRYVLVRKLGAGGMGVVYQADDVDLERQVAVKLLGEANAERAKTIERFQRESKLLANVNHPNVVTVHDVGRSETGSAFIVMELVAGTAQEFVDGRRPREWRRVTEVIRDACRGLSAAHGCNILHRDVKPANILLAADGTAKLADFGLAKPLDATAALSATNEVQGTLLYMSPEHLAGRPDKSSDLYSLGLSWYAMLAGRHPAPRAVPDLRGIPEGCAAVIRKALADPRTRYRTAGEMLADIEKLLQSPSAGPSRRRLLVLAGAGMGAIALVAGGLASWLMMRERERGREEPPDPSVVKGKEEQGPAQVKRLRVWHKIPRGEDREEWGVMGGDSLSAAFDDQVKIEVEFTHPLYAYLIAFNANGKEQLLWPVGTKKTPDENVSPPKMAKIAYPVRTGKTFFLNDEPKGGMQAFVVAASREALPSYAVWKQQRGGAAWKRLPPAAGVWSYDAEGVSAVVAGKKHLRGKEGDETGVPPLEALCESLKKVGVEVVEAVAFGVKEKP